MIYSFLLSNLSAAGSCSMAQLQRPEAQGVQTGVSYHSPTHF